MSSVRRQRLLWMGVAALLAVNLAACGGAASSSGSASPHPPSGASSPPATAQASGASSASPNPASIDGFQAASVTFVSTDDGWALGTASIPPCSGTCLAIARTQDGGATWSPIAAPPTSFYTASAPTSVSQVRFADTQDGWAFGSQLWATHDGGSTWAQVTLPGLVAGGGEPPIEGLEAAADTVQAVYDTGSGFRIASSPVGSDSWTPDSPVIAYGAGPVPVAQLVVQGSSAWVVENDRVVVGAVRLRASGWSTWTPPCSSVAGPETLAASSTQDLVAICDDGLWAGGGGSPSERAYVSSNGGNSDSELSVALPSNCQNTAAVGAPVSVASATASLTAVGCGGDIDATFNGGGSWSTVYTSSGSVTYLGFTSASQGVAIEAASSGSLGSLLMTTDGGRHWVAVSI